MNNKIKIAIIAVSVLFGITLFIGPEEVTTFVTVKPTFQEIKNEAIKVGAITAEQFFNFLSANYSNKLVKN